eukprot:403362556
MSHQQDYGQEDEICRVFDRLGVCLEPDMCPFAHPQLYNVQATAFVPTWKKTGGLVTQQEAMDQLDQDSQNFTAQYGSTKVNGVYGSSGSAGNVKMEGYEVIEGVMIVESQKGCECCKGMVNNCLGAACANLGVCYCYVHNFHQQ